MSSNQRTKKRCRTCFIEKPLSDYYAKRDNKDNHETECKLCKNARRMARYYANHDYYKVKSKESRDKNIVTRQIYNRNFMAKERAKYGGIDKWTLEHPAEARASQKRSKAKWEKKPKNKLRIYVRNMIGRSLKGEKGLRKWQDLVGYTLLELKQHLENQFRPGMSWDNYGAWHIDHIIPVSVFNFDKPEHIDFKRCWALENLQPMWAKENIRKKDKLSKPFQPMLKLALPGA